MAAVFQETGPRPGLLTLPNRVVLAPMSGVTDLPFRRLAAEQGAGLVVSEMTACAALAEGRRVEWLRIAKPATGLRANRVGWLKARASRLGRGLT